MSQRQRIPGLNEGQIYTYPSKRWRKKRRQYLMNFLQPRRKEIDSEGDLHTISTIENPAASEDSKDSVGLKDDNTKVTKTSTFPLFIYGISKATGILNWTPFRRNCQISNSHILQLPSFFTVM